MATNASSPAGRILHARIEDMDRPLHRILPVWLFEQACRLRQLTLVKPALWLDPREDPCASFFCQPATRSAGMVNLCEHLFAAWAQCWSYEANSDVLLRAYSRVALDPLVRRNVTPAEEGVRVTTTAARLLAAMRGWSQSHPSDSFYLAGVMYEPEGQFGQDLVNRLAAPNGLLYFETPDGRADSLFIKRDRFSHEQEVRLLCVGTQHLDEGEAVRHFPIEPDQLFTEVSFDPRLMEFERKEREQRLRKEGYGGIIVADSSYGRVLNQIPVAADWLTSKQS